MRQAQIEALRSGAPVQLLTLSRHQRSSSANSAQMPILDLLFMHDDEQYGADFRPLRDPSVNREPLKGTLTELDALPPLC